MTRNLRIALFSHDSLGLGHIRRNRALAFALAKDLPALTGRPVSGLLIAGNPEAARFDLPDGWDWVILPGVTPAEGGYAPRALASTMEKLSALRAAAITAILDQQRPELFIVDRRPFGIDGELTEALDQMRAHGCRTVLGLREVLDTPAVIDAEWNRVGGPDTVAEAFDEVWIYGDPNVYDPRETGEVPPRLAAMAQSTGYLSQCRPAHSLPADDLAAHSLPADDRADFAVPAALESGRFVLTCLGGGSDGGALARIAVEAAAPAGHSHLVITGPQMDIAEAEALQRDADESTIVIRHSDDVPGLIARAEAVVCMGGYNTLAEVMATDTPALVIPRRGHRAEQPRRAFALAAAGAVDALCLDEANAAALSDWFGRQAESSIDRTHLDLSGLSTVPRLAADLLASDRSDVDAAGTIGVAGAVDATRTQLVENSLAPVVPALEETRHAV
ncbi:MULTISPECIES: glycosyltransferase [unclassified Brevibacterium]|uniref:glycosyltransferase family protein n=1 Tax=unclassified Brevibacterium TaxID=2614124 RepID=UPI001E5E85C6|nr:MULTISPECIES: glycosyltransferase [unclassified Brevibacterium]MCD1285285.1 glycosyl transferase [Brevibacterium sp. CCUG 69071]MDK8434330.1 glycosyltransferase [Brevibacterium sp. H-BE7]